MNPLNLPSPLRPKHWARRDWLLAMGAGVLLPWAAPLCAHAESGDPPSTPTGLSLSSAQLSEMLQPHFPINYSVPGFLTLSLNTPRLTMRPQTNRIEAEMQALANGQALNRLQNGWLTVGFALRYEAYDRTVRAHHLRVSTLSFPGLKPEAQALIQRYGPALADASLQEVVLHQFNDKDLAILDVMGMRPGEISVTPTGLLIGFEAKSL